MGDFSRWLWKQFSEATTRLVFTAAITAAAITIWTATRDTAPSVTSLGWLLVATALAFGLVLLVGIAGWAKNAWATPHPEPMKQPGGISASTAVDTRVRLQYLGMKRIPLQISQSNIWRWFSLEAIGHVRNSDGTTSDRSLHTFLAIVFDRPASYAQIVVSSPNMPVPLYEVRDHSPRHAIIQIMGDVGVGELEIRAIQ